LALCLGLGACQGPFAQAQPSADNSSDIALAPTPGVPSQGVADVENLPQDPAWYLAQPGARAWSLDPAYQRELARRFHQEFLAPWRHKSPSHDARQVRQGFLDFLEGLGFGEDHRPHGQAWLQELLQYAGLENYPNRGYPGISLGPADLRSLPTRRPHLDGFAHPGQGYAFDNLQQSLMPANTPLYVAHASRDGAWLLCDSPYGLWWVQADKVARAGPALRRIWQRTPLAALTMDQVALNDNRGAHLFSAGIGTLFPLAKQGPRGLEVLAAVARDGQARTRGVRLGRQQAQPWPLPLSASAVARQAGVMLQKPYGWGGSYGNRDCSALLKDLFTPFGLWLPRNSAQQAQEGGQFLPLGHLPPQEREQYLLARGVPFLTLVWRPGHIMLYIGAHQGRAMVLHSLWGLKISDQQGREGRQVVGRSVITSLLAGQELPQLARPEGLLLNRVEGMTLLAPAEGLR
jgi:cell wall-associated NlpC family hydrolase